jgi:hypothetical protein
MYRYGPQDDKDTAHLDFQEVKTFLMLFFIRIGKDSHSIRQSDLRALKCFLLYILPPKILQLF